MGVADWIILAFLLFSVVMAAWEGFFHEAFGLAGLIVGYLLAAWQYRRVGGGGLGLFLKAGVGGRGGVLLLFFFFIFSGPRGGGVWGAGGEKKGPAPRGPGVWGGVG